MYKHKSTYFHESLSFIFLDSALFVFLNLSCVVKTPFTLRHFESELCIGNTEALAAVIRAFGPAASIGAKDSTEVHEFLSLSFSVLPSAALSSGVVASRFRAPMPYVSSARSSVCVHCILAHWILAILYTRKTQYSTRAQRNTTHITRATRVAIHITSHLTPALSYTRTPVRAHTHTHSRTHTQWSQSRGC